MMFWSYQLRHIMLNICWHLYAYLIGGVKFDVLYSSCFFPLCFPQVLSWFCKANPSESSSELVKLQPQKSSFQCSSITRMRDGGGGKKRKILTSNSFSRAPFGLRPSLIPSFLLLTKPRDPGFYIFTKKTETWTQLAFSRPTLPFFY